MKRGTYTYRMMQGEAPQKPVYRTEEITHKNMSYIRAGFYGNVKYSLPFAEESIKSTFGINKDDDRIIFTEDAFINNDRCHCLTINKNFFSDPENFDKLELMTQEQARYR